MYASNRQLQQQQLLQQQHQQQQQQQLKKPTPKPSPSNSREIQILNDGAIRYNHYLLDYCQTSVSALSGCTAGVLGLTGLYGFAFYFICSICVSAAICALLGDRFDKYFLAKQQIFTGPLWSGIQTYLLFWTFLYGMVHVY